MSSEEYAWDFFLAHANADKLAAERLYSYLQPHSRVFLDSRSIKLGDDWDIALKAAQQKSLITVVLVSSGTEAAYYQREEIAAAIALARQDAEKHRVVPVFMGRGSNDGVPYGLKLKHGLTVSKKLSIKKVGDELLRLLFSLKYAEKPSSSSGVPLQGGRGGHSEDVLLHVAILNRRDNVSCNKKKK